MLHPQTFEFLAQLELNNNKPWFDDNRKLYEVVRANLVTTIQELIEQFATLDPAIGKLLSKNCIFRINRDIRFSTNKAPYKNNMGAWFSAGTKNEGRAGYYLHLQHNNSFVAAGNYMPMPDVLKKIRQEIDYNGTEFEKILTNKKFAETFRTIEGNDALKNIPKGYDVNHAQANYLKLKSFEVSTPYTNEQMLNTTLVTKVMNDYKVAQPYVNFLNIAFD